MTPQEAGRKGNQIARQRDPQHQRKAGKNGFAATVAGRWNGDKQGYIDYLHRRSHDAQVEALTHLRMRQELAGGKPIVVAELSCLEDYEPQSWAERVRGREESTVDLPW